MSQGANTVAASTLEKLFVENTTKGLMWTLLRMGKLDETPKEIVVGSYKWAGVLLHTPTNAEIILVCLLFVE